MSRTRVVLRDTTKTLLLNQQGNVKRLSDLLDVDISLQEDGTVLIYDSAQGTYVSKTLPEAQILWTSTNW